MKLRQNQNLTIFLLQGLTTEKFDVAKLTHLAGWGYVLAPSYMALWYSWLDTRFVATTTRVIAIKVALDQTMLTIPLLLGKFSDLFSR